MWIETETQVKFIFLRHGKTKGNEEQRYIGKTDEPLSEAGIQELLMQKKKGVFPDIQSLYESPMKRCRMTGEILYPAWSPILVPEWKEIDFGIWEGKNYEELRQDESYQAWIDSGGKIPFPKGESKELFIRRCVEGFQRIWKEICENKGQQPEAIGVIAHGGTIMAILSHYLDGAYFAYQVKNGQGYVCTVSGTKEKFCFANVQKIE